jgi:hypothetical protein
MTPESDGAILLSIPVGIRGINRTRGGREMLRTNVELDEKLRAEAMKLTRIKKEKRDGESRPRGTGPENETEENARPRRQGP